MTVTCAVAAEKALEHGFRNPPHDAKPYTWWHWVDGNVTREGITGDLEAMTETGVGGALMFNIGGFFPEGPEKFMDESWLALVDHAVREAGRLGLDFGVHNCDGWSESGGPWITPETSMKELSWSVTEVAGPKRYDAVLPRPHANLDFYRDIAVLAYPASGGGRLNGAASGVKVTSGGKGDAARLIDGDPSKGVTFHPTARGNHVTFAFAKPKAVRSIVFRGLNRYALDRDFATTLEVSKDGETFEPVMRFTINWDTRRSKLPVTVACDDAEGRVFRLTFRNPWPLAIGEVELHDTARVHFYEAKAGWLRCRGHGGEARYFQTYPGADRHRSLPAGQVLSREDVRLITGKLKEDRLAWNVPPGRWHILRLGYTSNGHINRPATPAGTGLECDKLDPAVVRFHLDRYVGKLIERNAPLVGKSLTMFETDSWECEVQNWTEGLEKRFEDEMGYDILRFMPLIAEGIVMDSPDISERALRDWRKFLADQISEKYFATVAAYAKKHDLVYVAETSGRQQYLYDPIRYQRNSAIPMGEFWVDTGPGQGVRIDNRVAASVAHIAGKRYVASEAYTSSPRVARWQNHPYTLKALGDKAFCHGVNKLIFHTFAHQPRGDLRPGFTMALWGLHFNRGNTWWEPGRAWIETINRTQFMLQEGRFVADVLHFLGDDVPERLGWGRELTPPLPFGYDFDGCDAEALRDARVEDGELVLASGMRYRVLLLPDRTTMCPDTLAHVERLVRGGVTLVGPRPVQSPSLRDVGKGDRGVAELAGKVWGACDGEAVKESRYGKGRVFWGLTFQEIFDRLSLAPDFDHDGVDGELLAIHRQAGDADAYFVSNQAGKTTEARCAFRVTGRVPELWDPATGGVQRQAVYREVEGRTIVPLRLDPSGSAFVVFREPATVSPVVAVRCGSETLLHTQLGKRREAVENLAARNGFADVSGTFTMTFWARPTADVVLPKPALSGTAGLKGQRYVVYPGQGEARYGEGHAAAGVSVGRNGVAVFEHSARYLPALAVHRTPLADWTHVAVVYRDGQPTVFIDGRAVVTGLKSRYVVHPSSKPGGGSQAFAGSVKDVRVFDRALEGGEVVELAERRTFDLRPDRGPDIVLSLAGGNRIAATVRLAGRYVLERRDGSTQTVNVDALPDDVPVEEAWEVRFPEGLGAPTSVTIERLLSFTEHTHPGVKHFSGTATYRKTFKLAEDLFGEDRVLTLDLGDVQVLAEVVINGREAGILWKPPFCVDATNLLRPGQNELVVKVTNLWPNRLIGDARHPDGVDWQDRKPFPKAWPDWLREGKPRPAGPRITFSSRKVYGPGESLLPSGLLGPVVIRPGVKLSL